MTGTAHIHKRKGREHFACCPGFRNHIVAASLSNPLIVGASGTAEQKGKTVTGKCLQAVLACFLTGLALLCLPTGCQEKPKDAPQIREEMKQQESAPDRMSRWRREAEGAIRSECTNIVGFRRVLKVNSDIYASDSITNWTGKAEVEILNRIGGVEVTNVPIDFSIFMGELHAHIDTIKIRKADFDKWFSRFDGKDELHIADRMLDHVWTFKRGAEFKAFYVASTATNIWVKKGMPEMDHSVTNVLYSLPVSELCDEDQKLAARLWAREQSQREAKRRQDQFDLETKRRLEQISRGR